ncbi:MAG: hypothetical protein M9941_04710 [Anaerolineae bacterium]|nr:hypothetical protein [Anaerolineae bacterium]
MQRLNWLAIPLILLFFWLAVSSMVDDSPTMDEQNHIARGIALLRTGDPRLSLEHPPLVNTLSALPLLTMPDLRLPTDQPSWSLPDGWYEFARLFLWDYNVGRVLQIVFLARLPIVFITLALGIIGYRFAREMWGSGLGTDKPMETDAKNTVGIVAGLLALFLLLFDPNILAHGRYSTTDVGGTTFLLLAIYLLWRMWQIDSWAWRKVIAAALGLGLAFSAKLSILTFAPIMAVVAMLPLYPEAWSGRAAWRRLAQLITAGAMSILVVWALFAFQWGPFAFESEVFSSLSQSSGPMPTFWAGVERIFLTSEGGRMSFLAGQFSDDGFRIYFPVAFAVKMPLAILVLIVISVFTLMAIRKTRRRALFLLIPGLLYFTLSMWSGLNIGFRHLLPMLPLLYVLIGGLALVITPHQSVQHQTARYAVIGLCGWLLLTTMWIYPHFVSTFNLLAGGPRNGYNILIDSNVDWGQDLLRLKRWMDENEVASVKLSYFGSADPQALGITYEPLPGDPLHRDLWWAVPFNRTDPEPGVYAISVHNLQEMPLRPEEKTVYAWFRAREPDEWIGNSIAIYEVP